MLPRLVGGMVVRFLFICIAGAAGTGARYGIAVGLLRWLGPSFPYGTLTVNIVGSFLAAAVMELGLSHGAIPEDVRAVLVTGFMGGFTTYSSFNYEMLAYAHRGSGALAATYVVATLAGCGAAGVLGFAAARWVAAG